MQGDIVKAAKWLGGSMVLASFILVVGFHPTVTGHVVRIAKVRAEADQLPSPVPPAQSFYSPQACDATSLPAPPTGPAH
ncbi:MAG: hypothetical protein U0746_07645 [Gemmataceae bacterium]